MLTLPIKKEWYDLIKAGIKKEEYRDISPYYKSRFKKLFKGKLNGKYIAILLLRNGYIIFFVFFCAPLFTAFSNLASASYSHCRTFTYVLDIFSARELSELEEE